MKKNKSKRNADQKYKSFGNTVKFNGLSIGSAPVIQIANAFLLGYEKNHSLHDITLIRWQTSGTSILHWDLVPVQMVICKYNRGTQTYDILPEVRSAVARLGFSADEILNELLHTVTEDNMPVVIAHINDDIEADCTCSLDVICHTISKLLTAYIKKNAS